MEKNMPNKKDEHKKHETLRERSKENERALEDDEPFVLTSNETNPEFPAMSEYEVDEGGFKGSKKKHPGLIWAIIAIVAVIILCVVLMAAGDWFTPDQAEQVAQTQFEEEAIPEDLGAN